MWSIVAKLLKSLDIFFFRFACMEPASLTIVPDIKLPTVEGRQLSPENCVNSNKEVQSKLRVFCWGCLVAFIHRPKKIQQSCCGRVKTKNKVKIIKTIRKTMHGRTQSLNFFIKKDYTLHSFYVYSLLFILSMLSLLLDYPQSLS